MGALLPLRMLAELGISALSWRFGIVCIAVLIMRFRHPEIERPFRCPLVPSCS
ncbi:MAG TPA: hypothetical protein VI585_06950 [Candidatus Binatia bacterium]